MYSTGLLLVVSLRFMAMPTWKVTPVQTRRAMSTCQYALWKRHFPQEWSHRGAWGGGGVSAWGQLVRGVQDLRQIQLLKDLLL